MLNNKILIPITILMLTVLFSRGMYAQTTWTGTNGASWTDPGNWSAGVPDAADDVTIPDVANDPVIAGTTSALAKSVEVQSGAILTIGATASLTVNGSKLISGLTTAFYNNGTVENNGQLILGNISILGDIGIRNESIFNNNAGAEISIDRSTYGGLYNRLGTFTNAAKITIGANASVGSYGIQNQSTFNNNAGAEISIDRSFNFGMFNGGTFTNAAKITIGAIAPTSVGAYGILNQSTFDNTAGAEISIDRSTDSGLYNEAGTFTNAAKITIGAIASVGDYGLFNRATFSNNAGSEITIDRSTDSGLLNAAGTFTNAAKITIGANASVGSYGIQNQSTFNNNAGAEISIDRSFNFGMFNGGTFTNAAKITIGAIASVGAFGLWNQSTIDNNAGSEISIDRSTNTGMYNIGTFTNAAKITIGAIASVGSNGILNITTFNNSVCSSLINIVSDNIILGDGDFTNVGRIIENASGISYILNNTGVVQNLNGGTFSIFSGNPATTFSGQLSACCPSGDILYVNKNATGLDDGTSWTNAYVDLQSALNSPCPGITQIWVARGTYIPTTNSSDRDASFVMKAGVGIYGGFVGGETLLSQRNWVTNPTILSGDIDNSPGDNTGNSYHVVIAAFADDVPTTRLDGFTITGGNANADGNITVNGVGIFRNFGGGMYTNGGTNTMTNNTISGNTARSDGGGMYTNGGTNTLPNNTISGNTATNGGGIFTSGGTNTLTNNTISGNTASSNGGGISTGGTNTLTNNTISGIRQPTAAGFSLPAAPTR
ncbi:MAG: hypothetical protein IPO98_09815 [Saprospiraceae bacterium]|nr:hypothetical protein [Saprospiraceae bacterium]